MRSNSTALRIRARKSPKPPSPSSQDDVDVEQSFRRPPASFLVAVARFASRDDARLYRYDAAHASPASETSLPREIRSKGSPSASAMSAGSRHVLRADQQSVRVTIQPSGGQFGSRPRAWHGMACDVAMAGGRARIAEWLRSYLAEWQPELSIFAVHASTHAERSSIASSPHRLHPASQSSHAGPAQRMAAQDNKTEKKRSWTSQLSPHRSAVSSCRRG